MKMTKILNNRDSLKMGRVLTEYGWLQPLYRGQAGEFKVPVIGEYVLVKEKFYIPNKIMHYPKWNEKE
jgi:hypothetical protein